MEDLEKNLITIKVDNSNDSASNALHPRFQKGNIAWKVRVCISKIEIV